MRESNSTGDASIRPVVDAKKKLSDRAKGLPEVQARNITDAAPFSCSSSTRTALDALTYTY